MLFKMLSLSFLNLICYFCFNVSVSEGLNVRDSMRQKRQTIKLIIIKDFLITDFEMTNQNSSLRCYQFKDV